MYATYTFYTDTYLGSALTEQEFARASKRASSFIDYYTIGKAKDYPDDDNALAMCCCALAEQYQIIENAKVQSMSGGEVKSQTVGAWSKTYASGVETAEAARKTLEDIAMDYLAWTGLLYRGGQRCVPTYCDCL